MPEPRLTITAAASIFFAAAHPLHAGAGEGGVSADTIMETIRKGRTSTMPAFEGFLGEPKVHVLAAYVWSLSNTPEGGAAK